MPDVNDPRPVLRQELARVFKNQRVIRAFEKIFELIPPEFIDQQEQIDALVTALTILTDAISIAPPPTPISDVVNLSSYPALDTTITVSWTGVHTFAAAPTFTAGANVTGTLAVTGNITATTTVAATGAISGSNLSAAGGANPSASVGLAAVAGAATTFMRSDGAPALSQAITPTWTATHTFTPAAGRAFTANGVANQYTAFFSANNTAGQSFGIGLRAGTTVADLALEILNQAGAQNFLTILGNGDTTFGNAVGNPTYTFNGTSVPKHGGGQLIQGSAGFTNNAAAALGTLANAPVAGNPTKWIPINDNGVIRNIPAW